MLHQRPSDGVDPLLLLLLGIGDEVHGVVRGGGELEGAGLVEDVLGAFDGEARADGDDATWGGGGGHVGVFEPEELALLEDEPAAAPGLDVLALLRQPGGAFGVGPVLDARVVFWARVLARRGPPQTFHQELRLS